MAAEACAGALERCDRLFVAAFVDESDRFEIGVVAGLGAGEQQRRLGLEPGLRRSSQRRLHRRHRILDRVRVLACPRARLVELLQLGERGLGFAAIAELDVTDR